MGSFFIYDYQFERIWNAPNRYLNILKRFEGVITTDFSMFLSMPRVQQIWNCFRNRTIAYRLQSNEINIIPTAGWSDSYSYERCFDGLATGSTVAVTSVGTRRNGVYKNNFNHGLYELITRIKPDRIIVYGSLDEKIKDLYTGTEFIFYDNYCKIMRERI